jgi:hypothetical protein
MVGRLIIADSALDAAQIVERPFQSQQKRARGAAVEQASNVPSPDEDLKAAIGRLAVPVVGTKAARSGNRTLRVSAGSVHCARVLGDYNETGAGTSDSSQRVEGRRPGATTEFTVKVTPTVLL